MIRRIQWHRLWVRRGYEICIAKIDGAFSMALSIYYLRFQANITVYIFKNIFTGMKIGDKEIEFIASGVQVCILNKRYHCDM